MTSTTPPRLNSRRDAFSAAIPPAGASIANIAAALGISRKSAEQRLRAYGVGGHLFFAKIRNNPSGKCETWYFVDKASRDKAVSKDKRPKSAALKPSAWEVAINPNNVKPVRLPASISTRFATKAEDVPPLFSALKPGQYIDDGSGWAARVTA